MQWILLRKLKLSNVKISLAEACKGLAATEVAKLTELVEGVEADDNESFATKVATIKESYLNKDTTVEAHRKLMPLLRILQEPQMFLTNAEISKRN